MFNLLLASLYKMLENGGHGNCIDEVEVFINIPELYTVIRM